MKDLDRVHKTIVVTGGTGYIGSRVVQALASRGFMVRATDRTMPEEHGIELPRSALFLHGDLRDSKFAAKALDGADAVVHLAADIGSVAYMHTYQADIIQRNSEIDSVLYRAAVTAGNPCVIYSSSSMVFQHARAYPYREEDLAYARIPTNVYGFSKLSGEYFCRAYHAQYGLPYVILRYHNIYGPGERAKGEGAGNVHVIPALIEKALSGQYPIELLGGERATRVFTYIDDAVDATALLVERALTRDASVLNEDFNIGSDEAISIIDLAEMIWEMAGDGRPFQYVVREHCVETAERREMAGEKIRSAVGWRPNVGLREGIARTAEWMKKRTTQ